MKDIVSSSLFQLYWGAIYYVLEFEPAVDFFFFDLE